MLTIIRGLGTRGRGVAEDETNCGVAKTSDQSDSSRLLSNSREEIVKL